MTACSGLAVASSSLGPEIVHHPGEASVRSPSQVRLPGFGELERRAEQGGAARVGWPAPARPEDAIDAAEHDLAQIESLFHLPEEQPIGTACYLLGVNPHLARGALPGAALGPELDGRRRPVQAARRGRRGARGARLQPARVLADGAPALHDLPYEFFRYAVQRLSPRQMGPAIEELDPLQRCRLVHDEYAPAIERV